VALIDRKVYNTLTTAPNAVPASVGSDRFPIASIQVDNFSGKYIQVDGTQFVPPFAQGWVTTLAPTPKTSVPIAVTVPPVGSQTGNDGTVVITLFEDAIGSSGGSTSQYSPIPEVVSFYINVSTSVGGTVQNLNLTQLGITGGNFYIKRIDFTYNAAIATLPLVDAAAVQVNFGTARGNGIYDLWISPESPFATTELHDLLVNSATVPYTGFAEANTPVCRMIMTFSQA